MIVRIGVAESTKELEIELDEDAQPDDIKAGVEAALENGEAMLWLTDRHGRQVGVPSNRVAYVDLGAPGGGPKIGFGA